MKKKLDLSSLDRIITKEEPKVEQPQVKSQTEHKLGLNKLENILNNNRESEDTSDSDEDNSNSDEDLRENDFIEDSIESFNQGDTELFDQSNEDELGLFYNNPNSTECLDEELNLKEITNYNEIENNDYENIDNYEDCEQEYNYIPLEYRFQPDFIVDEKYKFNSMTFTIIADNGEINGVREYDIISTVKSKLIWFNKDRTVNYDIYKQMIQFLSESIVVKSILKPSTIMENESGFGYIRNSITNYYPLSEIIENKVKFNKVDTILKCVNNIVEIFRSLEPLPLAMYNFKESDVLVDIDNGNIIMDITQMCCFKGDQVELLDYEYNAPEVVKDKTFSQSSLQYTLSVVLFKLFYKSHPLEGNEMIKNSLLAPNKHYYSDKAEYVLKPNTLNYPVRGVHYNLLGLREAYPRELLENFNDIFIDNLFNTEKRLDYSDLLNRIAKLKFFVVNCDCGFSGFINQLNKNEEIFICKRCGKIHGYLYFMKSGLSVPINEDTRIYKSFVDGRHDEYENDLMGIIISNKINTNLLGIKNTSTLKWNCELANGDLRIINPQETVPLLNGSIIDMGYSRVLINRKRL